VGQEQSRARAEHQRPQQGPRGLDLEGQQKLPQRQKHLRAHLLQVKSSFTPILASFANIRKIIFQLHVANVQLRASEFAKRRFVRRQTGRADGLVLPRNIRPRQGKGKNNFILIQMIHYLIKY